MKIRVKGYKRFYKAISNKAHLFPVKVPIQGKNKSYYGIRWKSGTKAMEYIKKDNKIPKDTNMVFETKDGKKKGLTENQVLSLYEKTGKNGSLQDFIRANFKKPKAEDDGQLSFNDMAAGNSKQTKNNDVMNQDRDDTKNEETLKEKRYLADIENLEQIKTFEDLSDYLEEDEQGQYFEDAEEFEWWNELANAMQYLEDEDVDYDEVELNELEDYIKVAKENGFRAKQKQEENEETLKEKDKELKEKRAKQREKEVNAKLKPITDGEYGKIRKFGTKKIESAGEYPKAKNLNDFVNRTKAMKDFHLDIKGRAMLDMFGIHAPLFNKRNGKNISLSGGKKVGGYCSRNGFGDTYEIALVSETRNNVWETKTTVHECMHSKLRNSVHEALSDITLNKPSRKETIRHDIEETLVEMAGQGVSNMIHGNDTDKELWGYETIVAQVAPMIWGAPEFKEARKNGLHGVGQEICKRLMNDDTGFVQNVVDEYLEAQTDNSMNDKMEDRYKAIETKIVERTDKVEKIQQDTGKSDIANLVEELKRGTISLEGALHSSKYRELAAVLITKFLEDEDIEALEQLALSF